MMLVHKHVKSPPLTRGLSGRAYETGLILDAVQAAAAGLGSLVLVEAELGLGKTRFLAEARTIAAERGFDVAGGAGEGLAALLAPLAVLSPGGGGKPTPQLITLDD